MVHPSSRIPRRVWYEAVGGLVLIALGFAAIAASDVSPQGTHRYWIGLAVLYGVATWGSGWLSGNDRVASLSGALAIALHWIGVLVAIQAVYMFVSSGRMANADAGLANGLILALGMFTAGSPANWRPLLVGAALAAATAAVALVEEYLWVLLGLAVLAVAILALGTRLSAGRSVATDE